MKSWFGTIFYCNNSTTTECLSNIHPNSNRNETYTSTSRIRVFLDLDTLHLLLHKDPQLYPYSYGKLGCHGLGPKKKFPWKLNLEGEYLYHNVGARSSAYQNSKAHLYSPTCIQFVVENKKEFVITQDLYLENITSVPNRFERICNRFQVQSSLG